MGPVRIEVLYEKEFAEPVSCFAVREKPTHYKKEGIQPFDVGNQGNESPFWTLACTCRVAQKTTPFIAPGAHTFHLNLGALATSSPSLYLYRMLKDPSRADRLARLPPSCLARRITSSLALFK